MRSTHPSGYELLWTAQRSRHAGGPDTRDQLLTETEAAVTLAITLVQWFASGFVQRREDDLCRVVSAPTPYGGKIQQPDRPAATSCDQYRPMTCGQRPALNSLQLVTPMWSLELRGL